jgi:predicted nucleic acid-binding protein
MLDDGSIQAVTSELCLAECLGGPYRTGREDLASIYIDLIRDRPQLTVNAITREILIEAARLRSEVRTLRLPDAIHHATARIAACDILLTNDERFRGVARPEAVLLSDISIDG